ncbi:unnamed protein product [Strongylus vulgaris]|uniref:Uncharacterized protein n=1 Tax=Strongylus vulgaris TaxID=40348 RepID=A0A3P7IIF6_STRVU|nr:unnamed protein product [Strongylus vulgaris]
MTHFGPDGICSHHDDAGKTTAMVRHVREEIIPTSPEWQCLKRSLEKDRVKDKDEVDGQNQGRLEELRKINIMP